MNNIDSFKFHLSQGLYQHALDYSKSASEKVYELLKSFSGISSYLPVRLREGADSALKQVILVEQRHTTLKSMFSFNLAHLLLN